MFGEHGLLEHRASVYPELTRVPLVIAAPGRLPVGLRVETPVQLQDVYPTLLDLAGIATLPGSLLPVIAGGERTGPIVAVAWPFSYWARLVGGRFKHLWHLYREGDEALVFSSGGDLELYDVAADPGMTRDLSGARSERAAALKVAAETYFGGLSDLETPAVVFPDEIRAHLAEPGYVVEEGAPRRGAHVGNALRRRCRGGAEIESPSAPAPWRR